MSQKEIEQVRSKIQEEDVFDEASNEIEEKLDREKVDQIYDSTSANNNNIYDWESKNELYKYYFLNSFIYYRRGINTFGTVTLVKPDEDSIVLTIKGIDETNDETGIIKSEKRAIRIDPSNKDEKSMLDYLMSRAGVNKPSELVGESVPISSEKEGKNSRRITLYKSNTWLHKVDARKEQISRQLGLIQPNPNGNMEVSSTFMLITFILSSTVCLGIIQSFGFTDSITSLFAVFALLSAIITGTGYIFLCMYRLVMGVLSYITDENVKFIQDWSR